MHHKSWCMCIAIHGCVCGLFVCGNLEIVPCIVENFAPTVLINESLAYFNRKLFPYINEFERKLRKFLYLKSAIYTGEKRIENIRDLESKDLGEIFVLLFTDAEFVKASKTKVIH